MESPDSENRKESIAVLVFLTGRPETYFKNFTDERLAEEYDRYNQPKKKGGK
ncbi:MAG TPA: hypothetical protein K8V56_13625 [Sporosarcina psychrophila]|uniref:Uncharacterized protein n=1 Tax=Sporosarcina psychrophila TaxID=1476 RepID=A0A921G1A1_SPOPS|nr:hypothetical protein [Sporosarcina psychrophila]